MATGDWWEFPDYDPNSPFPGQENVPGPGGGPVGSPPGGSSGGDSGACPAGMVPESIGADGNWRTASPGECISQAEFDSRVDRNIRDNPNRGEGQQNRNPAPSGPRPPYAPNYNIPGAPMFAGLPDFQAPSFEEAMNDPGYRFAVDEGRRAREASAASRGDLRTGGTLRSLDRYGQNMGAQQYSNVYGRRFGEYGQRYRQALDQYSPRLAEWTLRSNAEIGRQNIGNQNQWGEYWGNNLTAAQLMALLQGI